jgi:hypothetical protein
MMNRTKPFLTERTLAFQKFVHITVLYLVQYKYFLYLYNTLLPQLRLDRGMPNQRRQPTMIRATVLYSVIE